MSNEHPSTTSRQLCDTTTSSQHPVTQPVTQQASNQQASTHSVLSKLVTARACARAHAREDDYPEGIITPDDLMAIRDAYVTYVGQPMTAMVAHEVEGCPLPMACARRSSSRRRRSPATPRDPRRTTCAPSSGAGCATASSPMTPWPPTRQLSSNSRRQRPTKHGGNKQTRRCDTTSAQSPTMIRCSPT